MQTLRTPRLRWARVACLLLPGLLFAACREPTQVTLHVSTDAKCVDVQGTSITVGAHGKIEEKDPVARTTRCAETSGDIGTLVVVPSGDKDDEVSVRVVTGVGKSAESCVKDGYVGGCIVARRTLRFLPHTPVDLPIAMSVDCLDVPCEATQTCLKGKCVSSQTVCSDGADCKLKQPGSDAGTPDTGTGGAAGAGGAGGSGGVAGSGGAAGSDAGSDASDAGSDASDAPNDVSVTCTGTLAECDGNPTQPCETDLATSAANCGKCGRSCLGGSCTAGTCSAVTLYTATTGFPSRLALDATHVYFVDYTGGSVRRMLKDGTGVELLAGGKECNRIAVDATHVYWTEATSKLVRRAPKTGGAPENLATGANSAIGIALGGTNVYFTDMSSVGAVNRVAKTGGAMTALSSNVPWPLEPALTSTHVYWTTFENNGAIRRAPLGGTTPEVVVAGVDNSFGIAVDATNLYFTVLGVGANKGQIQYVSLNATLPATPTTLATGQANPRGMVVDATHVYWTNSDGPSVAKIAIDGSDQLKPTMIATGGIEPLGIAVDDVAVYWADDKAGTIQRIAK